MEDSGIDSSDHQGERSNKRHEGHFPTSDSSTSVESGSRSSPVRPAPSHQPLTSKQLHRKLEARIEHAKRLHQEYSQSSGLIPIQRLSIPKGASKDQHQPLVQWDTDDSEEDIVNFFPMSRKESKVHQEITDTFSIEEMSISGDEEDEDDLHLVPPQNVYKKFSCCSFAKCCIL